MNKLLPLVAALFLFETIAAAVPILPDTIGDWKKGPATAAAVPDRKV